MELFINNHGSKPIYEQISDQIKALIISGELQAGEALPSIRSMARSLHISVLTVQKAYDKLQEEGFIETTAGKGCFVCGSEQTQQRERERWYSAFDESAAALMALGVLRQTLVQRIEEGGSSNA